MKYCRNCILPDSRPGLVIGEDGICQPCKTHGQKHDIDWAAREKAFQAVVENAKRHSKGYDCLIPVSGGKDSTWQVLRCLEYGLKPLTVTWRTPWRTRIGQENLDNMIGLGVDHIDYQINPEVERRFVWESFRKYGSTAIPMHMAIFNIPLTLAVRLGIPLVVQGENPTAEYMGGSDEFSGFELTPEWIRRHGVTHETTAADWVSDTLSRQDLTAYFSPSDDEVTAAGVKGIFLGQYFRWDPEETYQTAKAHGFKADPGGARTGLYDFADIDDDCISIHHWMKWYKFGMTRLWDNLSLEIRNGRITREQAVAIVAKTGDQTPHGDIEKFCAWLRIPVSDFHAAAETFRNTKIWGRRDGTWTIDNFLIPDWKWS